jgi:hypothetical protein
MLKVALPYMARQTATRISPAVALRAGVMRAAFLASIFCFVLWERNAVGVSPKYGIRMTELSQSLLTLQVDLWVQDLGTPTRMACCRPPPKEPRKEQLESRKRNIHLKTTLRCTARKESRKEW